MNKLGPVEYPYEDDKLLLDEEELHWTGEAFYEGHMSPYGKPEGRGIMYYPDGDVYEGEFLMGLPDGYGRWYGGEDLTGEWFEGYWRVGLKEGQGVYHTKINDVYHNHWHEDLKNGEGFVEYANGDSFEGRWEMGEIEGIGTYTTHDGDV